MIPHPTTWQTARERQRQDLLASAERHNREMRAQTGTAGRMRAARAMRSSGRIAAYRTTIAGTLAPFAHAVRERNQPHPRQARPNGPRLLARFLTLFIATLLVLPVAEGTQTAEAGKKFKTITKTFASNGQIDIPDNGTEGPADPYPSIIEVDAFEKYKKAKITDVNLTLRNFSHTLPENVDVMLALGNRKAIVMGDAGGGDDAVNLTVTLDDQATDELPNGDELFSGTYKPANLPGVDPFPAPAPAPNANDALSTFKNAKPDGEWRLFVHDDFNTQVGEIAGGWKIEITAKVKDGKKKGKDKDTTN